MRQTPNSLRAKWTAYARTPFPLLVRLFVNRIVQGNQGGEDDLPLSLGLVLSLLAIPGGFISLFLFDKYGSFLQWLRGQPRFDPLVAAMPDEYFFIVLSMAVIGGVALWWWDSIFPDRRDFENLVPLPIPTYRIFLANGVALLLLAGLFAADVNAASCILFPAVVGASQPSFSFLMRFATVHALVVMLASIFAFFMVFALVGLLMALLPYSLFRRISLYLRGLIGIGLVAALSTSFAVPRLILHLTQSSNSPLRFLPSVWFLGLCQLLRGRADPVLGQLGRIAPLALLTVGLVAVAGYSLSYRRCFVRLPELEGMPTGQPGARTAFIFRLLDFLILRTPVQRSGYRFVFKTLFRSETHALALVGFATLGIVMASGALFSAYDGEGLKALPSPELLSIPLILNYCLLIGIRLIFDIPSKLAANWIFRLLLEGTTPVAIARRVMISLVLPWLFGVAFPVYLYFWGWKVALLHTALVAVWSVLLSEILLVRFRKLPFTCTYPPFRHSAVVAAILYVLGFLGFAGMTSELEFDMLLRPAAGIALVAIALAAWGTIRYARHAIAPADKQIIFEHSAVTQFEFLHLSDGG
jgi:hypothetical protein